MKLRIAAVLLLGLLVTMAGAQTPQQYVTGVNWECSLNGTPEIGLLGAASIASAGGNIYVLQGNTLRKLDINLREIASVQLPDLLQCMQVVQTCRQDLSCGMNSDAMLTVPTGTAVVAASPVQCAAQDMVQGLHEAHTLRTLTSAQLSADAFGVYLLRGGRLTVYDTNLRELRNTPITDSLTASAATCPVCTNLMANGPLMDQLRYRGMIQGIGPSVVTTVGYVQPATGAYAPNTAWSDTIGSTYGPYTGGVPWGYARVTPSTTGTYQAGTAVSPGIVRSGYGVRTTPGTTGTVQAGTAVSPGITRVYGGGPSGVGTPGYAGTSSWGVAPGGVFWGAPGTYGAPPSAPLPPAPSALPGGRVVTPTGYSDFSEVRGTMIGDGDEFAQAAGGRAGGRAGGVGTGIGMNHGLVTVGPGVTTTPGVVTTPNTGVTGTGMGITPNMGTAGGSLSPAPFSVSRSFQSMGANTQMNTGLVPTGSGSVVNTGFGTTMNTGLSSSAGKSSGFSATTPTGFSTGTGFGASATSPTGRVMQANAFGTTSSAGGTVSALPGASTTNLNPFQNSQFAGAGTASSTGFPSVWGNQFGTVSGIGTATGFGTSGGIGTTQGNGLVSPVAPFGTTSLLQTIMKSGVGVKILPGTTTTVTTTVGTAETSVGNISVPANAVVMPGGIVVMADGTVLGSTGPVASNSLRVTDRTTITPNTGRFLVPGTSNMVTTTPGALVGPNGTLALPPGTIITRNGTVIRNDGTLIMPNGNVTTPNVTAAGLSSLFGGGFGTVGQTGYPVGSAFQQITGTGAETTPALPITNAPTYLPPDVTYTPAPAAGIPPAGYGEMLSPSAYAPVPTGWSGNLGQTGQTGMGFVSTGQPGPVLAPTWETPAAYTAPAEVMTLTAMAPVQLPPPLPTTTGVVSTGRTLSACANRVAWMYDTPLTPGHVVPIALRNIINGCVVLGYGGDAGGPKRLHMHVLRTDNLPDLSAKLSAFLYPKNQVDAGVALQIKSNGPGEYYADFDPNICDGDMVAVRVKRPGMREQVAYFSLAAPEVPTTGNVGVVGGAGYGPSPQPVQTGFVNPAYQTSPVTTMPSHDGGGQGPRVETHTGMSDVCPECGQKLPAHSAPTISTSAWPNRNDGPLFGSEGNAVPSGNDFR